MTAVRVFTDDARYRIALAELTESAVTAPSMHDADIVVGSRAAECRADQLAILTPDGSAGLDPPLGASVILERLWFRPDVEQDVVARREWFPRIEIEVTAPTAQLHAVMTDAAAWAGALAGAELRPGAGAATRFGGIADARAGDAVVTLQLRRREASAAALRIAAIGPSRVEIRVDDERRSVRVRIADEDGELVLPERWEDAARVTLRRAVEVRRSGVHATDLVRLRRDSRVADHFLRLITEADDTDRQPRIP
ncbi:hypothetical protein [Microbacterium sp. NPDC058345]|uniref:hypothetical protein n=1 Tax=Microbacterium sp. NPDC058345 TaxID=3346455 RepID=UPI00364EDD69